MGKLSALSMLGVSEAEISVMYVKHHPERYTLGKVELLRMLGMNAGKFLDWEDTTDGKEMAQIRKPRVTAPVSELDYPVYGIAKGAMKYWPHGLDGECVLVA